MLIWFWIKFGLRLARFPQRLTKSSYKQSLKGKWKMWSKRNKTLATKCFHTNSKGWMIGRSTFEASFSRRRKQYHCGIEWFHFWMGTNRNRMKAISRWLSWLKVFYTDQQIILVWFYFVNYFISSLSIYSPTQPSNCSLSLPVCLPACLSV